MKALKYTRPAFVEVVDEPVPRAAPGEMVVEVAYAGICGSDVHGVLPGGYRTPPLIMGHEFSGTTADGRRVAVNATVSCRQCDMCLRGRDQVCRQRIILGIHRQGGLAESVAVPESALVDLPQDTSLEAGALVEPLAVAVRGWKRAAASPGMRVGILGAGNIGLLLLAVGVQNGFEVDITDLDPIRMDAARRQGPAAVGTALDGEYDVVFDAVGALEAHTASVAHLTPGGTAVWIGSRADASAFDALDLVRSEKSVVASFAYTDADFREAAEMVGSVSLDWHEVVDLEHSADTFMDLVSGRSDVVKAIIRP